MRRWLFAALTVLSACSSRPAPPLQAIACDIVPPDDADVEHVAACATRFDDGRVVVNRDAIARVKFGENGVGSVRIDNQWVLVVRSGRTAPTVAFDNGPDPFADGLARTFRNGKIGYVNAELTEVIRAEWDFAFPFEGGVAKVCQGCASEPVSPDGEHRRIVGGQWGYIDRTGKVVVPVAYSAETLPKPAAVKK